MENEALHELLVGVRRLLILICFMVGIQTAAAIYPTLLQLAGTQQFVYTLESPDDTKLAATMTELGSYGWELVTARRAVSDGKPRYEMIFKRPK